MRSLGYSVLRFWNHDVLKRRRSVCDTILGALDGRLAEEVAAFDLRFVFARPVV
jgi:very-short-patch-repair endonuclease